MSLATLSVLRPLLESIQTLTRRSFTRVKLKSPWRSGIFPVTDPGKSRIAPGGPFFVPGSSWYISTYDVMGPAGWYVGRRTLTLVGTLGDAP